MGVGELVEVGESVGVGVWVGVGLGVKVGVLVAVGVGVQAAAVAVKAVEVIVACCSGEGPQAVSRNIRHKKYAMVFMCNLLMRQIYARK